jgi:PII-like signaling protein
MANHPDLFRNEGAAGATMLRGLAGFGAHSKLHMARLADIAPDLPVMVEWIDGPERVQRLLPRVCELVATGTILLDNLGIHTPRRSLLLRQLLEELRGQLILVYTPAYDPESSRIEWLWRSLRRAVTHTHTRETLPPLLEDAETWARTLTPLEILHQIGGPLRRLLATPLDELLILAA